MALGEDSKDGELFIQIVFKVRAIAARAEIQRADMLESGVGDEHLHAQPDARYLVQREMSANKG